uniref:Uncharacterized protein n=1 Tax=Anguilla anguilla TaxID=7936 RepID=A0A0E9T7V3_ANGAN
MARQTLNGFYQLLPGLGFCSCSPSSTV